MFEVQDLAVASPATVSRCGMVYLEPSYIGLSPFVECWLRFLPENIWTIQREASRTLWQIHGGLYAIIFPVILLCTTVTIKFCLYFWLHHCSYIFLFFSSVYISIPFGCCSLFCKMKSTKNICKYLARAKRIGWICFMALQDYLTDFESTDKQVDWNIQGKAPDRLQEGKVCLSHSNDGSSD